MVNLNYWRKEKLLRRFKQNYPESDPRTIDWDAEWDDTLSYEENITNLENNFSIRLSTGAEHVQEAKNLTSENDYRIQQAHSDYLSSEYAWPQERMTPGQEINPMASAASSATNLIGWGPKETPRLEPKQKRSPLSSLFSLGKRIGGSLTPFFATSSRKLVKGISSQSLAFGKKAYAFHSEPKRVKERSKQVAAIGRQFNRLRFKERLAPVRPRSPENWLIGGFYSDRNDFQGGSFELPRFQRPRWLD